METGILKIKMLGTFTMEYEGRPVSFERNTLTKTNRLLQILLYAGEKGITREQLLLRLFGRDEVSDPSNSLRATVFRVRKLLAAAGIPELDEYIQMKGGIYKWTSRIPVELDVAVFEKTANEALAEKEKEQRYELLKKACNLYTGEFLPLLGAEEWVVVAEVSYKKLYVECMNELCEMLMQRKEYQLLFQVAGNAVTIYPYDEWQVWQIESLIAQNRMKEAMCLYEDTADYLFREMGVSPSERMMECLSQMSSDGENRNQVIDEIQEELNEKEDSKGAFYCSYPSFSENYKYMKRVLKRTGQSAYLMLCTITDGKGYPLEKGERLERLNRELQEAICIALRRGDLYTKYSMNQFLILLLDIKQEDCQIVIDRINKRFENPSCKNYLRYHVSPLAEVKDTEGKIYFDAAECVWN